MGLVIWAETEGTKSWEGAERLRVEVRRESLRYLVAAERRVVETKLGREEVVKAEDAEEGTVKAAVKNCNGAQWFGMAKCQVSGSPNLAGCQGFMLC